MKFKQQIKELREKTVLLPETFEKYGLVVESIGFSEIEEDSFNVLVEIVSKKATGIKEDIYIKVNSYDEEGQLFAMAEATLYESSFDGYDTLSLFLHEPEVLNRVQKLRLYATR